jgi:hypothetical protein
VFTTTLLLEETGRTDNGRSYVAHDVEHSVDWTAKFPNTKFRLSTEMQADDAATALRVAFEAIRLLSQLTFEHVWIVTYEGERGFKILFQSDDDVESLLSFAGEPRATPDTEPPVSGATPDTEPPVSGA